MAVPRSIAPPTFWGAATYGLASPGVAAFYGSAFGNAGYSFVMSGLAPAQYTMQLHAHNTVTNGWTVFERPEPAAGGAAWRIGALDMGGRRCASV